MLGWHIFRRLAMGDDVLEAGSDVLVPSDATLDGCGAVLCASSAVLDRDGSVLEIAASVLGDARGMFDRKNAALDAAALAALGGVARGHRKAGEGGA